MLSVLLKLAGALGALAGLRPRLDDVSRAASRSRCVKVGGFRLLPSFREVGARGAAPSAARWAPVGLPPRVWGWWAPACCPLPRVFRVGGRRRAAPFPLSVAPPPRPWWFAFGGAPSRPKVSGRHPCRLYRKGALHQHHHHVSLHSQVRAWLFGRVGGSVTLCPLSDGAVGGIDNGHECLGGWVVPGGRPHLDPPVPHERGAVRASWRPRLAVRLLPPYAVGVARPWSS